MLTVAVVEPAGATPACVIVIVTSAQPFAFAVAVKVLEVVPVLAPKLSVTVALPLPEVVDAVTPAPGVIVQSVLEVIAHDTWVSVAEAEAVVGAVRMGVVVEGVNWLAS